MIISTPRCTSALLNSSQCPNVSYYLDSLKLPVCAAHAQKANAFAGKRVCHPILWCEHSRGACDKPASRITQGGTRVCGTHAKNHNTVNFQCAKIVREISK